MCHHCGTPMDSAEHTFLECPAWEGARRVLMNFLDLDERELSLEHGSGHVFRDRRKWEVATSCEEVILRKEDAERERERLPDTAFMRKRRKGRRAWT